MYYTHIGRLEDFIMKVISKKNLDIKVMNLQLFAEGSGEDNGGGAAPQVDISYMSGGFEDNSTMVGEDIPEVDTPEPEKEENAADSHIEEALKQKQQSKEADRAFAKMRKDNEALQAQVKQMEEYNAWVKEKFGVDDLKTYREQMDKQLREQKEAELKEAGYDPEMIREAIKNDPELANIFKDTTNNNTNAQAQQAQEQQINDQQLVSDYKEVAEKYSYMIKTPEDISAEVWDLYDKGIPLVKAFAAVNAETIIEKNQEIGKQKALNNINSKQHLKAEGDGTNPSDSIQMNSDTLQMYLDQGMTKAQAFAHYKKIYS